MSLSISSDEVVRASGLCKKFGVIDALNGVELTARKGIINAVVGPDGAGKTTFLRILAGIMTPTSGEINILGRDIVKNPESAKEMIGYLSQRFSLNPLLTVRENIDFFASLFKVPRSERGARTERLLEFSRLGPFGDRLAAHLSGGMKQKLSLCCALIHTPQLLLLDEPTTGVDPISRRELWEILYDLLGEGVTVILSTPYMDEAERAGQITLLHKGRSIITGDIENLRRLYRFTLYELVSQDNRQAFEIVSKKLDKSRVVFFGAKLHVAFEKNENPRELKTYLEQSGVIIKSYDSINPGLEDIFIQELSVV